MVATDRWSSKAERRTSALPALTETEEDTESAKPWIVASILLLIGGILLRSRLLVAAGAMLGLVIAAAWAWFKLSLVGVTYERSFCDANAMAGVNREVRAFLGESVELTLHVDNRKLLPLNWLRVVDVFPLEVPIRETEVVYNRATHQGEFSSFWMPGAYETLERRFTLDCVQRGYSTFGPATLSSGDGFGFFVRKARLPLEHRLIVYPKLYTAAEMDLPAQRPFGERASDQRIFEDPLRNAGIREWQPGDGMRRVHWKATAKHQYLLSRIYEPSEEPQIEIILNVATLERHWEGVVEDVHEHAVSVAGSLAQLALQNRLPVGLMANCYLPGSDQNVRLLPGRSSNQLTEILELLAAVTPYASLPIEDHLLRRAPSLPWGTTLVVVTGVTYDALYAALLELAQSGRKILLFSLADQAPTRPLPKITVHHLAAPVDDTRDDAYRRPHSETVVAPETVRRPAERAELTAPKEKRA